MLKSILSGVKKLALNKYTAGAALGYGIMSASNYAADTLDTGIGPYSAGQGITGLLRLGGTIAGGSMMATAGIRGAGSLLRKPINSALPGGKIASAVNSMANYSVGGNLLKGAFGGIGIGRFKTPRANVLGFRPPSLSEGLYSMTKGIVKSPFVFAADVAGTGLRMAGSIPGARSLGSAGRKLHSIGNKHWGARMFGIGTVAGAGKIAGEINSEIFSNDLREVNKTRMQEGYPTFVNTSRGRGLALAGQQIYDPISGGKARRMGSGGTSGLVQSLHKLR